MIEKFESNKRILIISVIGIALIIIGISYAFFSGNLLGLEQLLGFGDDIIFEYHEADAGVVLSNADIKSDENGKITTNYFDFEVSLKPSYNKTISYYIYITKEEGNTVKDSDVKLYLTDQNDVAISDIMTISSLKKLKTDSNSYYLYNTSITSDNDIKVTDDYRLRVFIDEDYEQTTLEEINNDTNHGVQLVEEEYKFKVNVSTGDVIIDESGANAPELATGMIPVYYDGETWKKADVTNTNLSYKWYNYDDKMWANAVTVTEENRETYINASVGTEIAIEDINTMWVWIPRFSATTNTLNCSTVINPTQEEYPNCYRLDDIVLSEITEEQKQELVNGIYFMYLFETGTASKADIRTQLDTAIINNDQDSFNNLLNIYSLYLMSKHFSSYVTLSTADKNYFVGNEAESIVKEFYDNDLSFLPLYVIKQNGGTVTSDITVPEDDEFFHHSLSTDFDYGDRVILIVLGINEGDTDDVLDALFSYSNDTSAKEYFLEKAKEKLVSYVYDSSIVISDYNGGTREDIGAFNITFADKNASAHDAFTFGTQNLSGFWMAKFELSSDTECSAGYYSELGTGCNLTTINPYSIPDVISWQGAMVSTFWTATRKMELNGNPYGFEQTSTSTNINSDGSITSDSNNIDTHMIKNNEWGAVAYLTYSLYGRCTTSINCSEVGVNSSKTTGYGAPSWSTIDDKYSNYVKSQPYNTNRGMDASTTGNIYGVYDMSGGAEEYAMGVYWDGNKYWSGLNELQNSGFNGYLYGDDIMYAEGVDYPDTKYFNLYTTEAAYTSAGLQHAIVETKGWHYDSNVFVDSNSPWINRGGLTYGGASGIFSYRVGNNGEANTSTTARSILTVE